LLVSVIWLLAAVATALPLGLYFWHHPEDFWSRANQVSIWHAAHPLTTFATGVVQTLLMFNIRGDRNWRHNISTSPELLLPVGLLFLFGISLAASKSFRERGLWAILFNRFSLPLWWLVVMLLPEELTAEGIPHALRAIGAIPAAMMLAAIGFDWLHKRRRFRGVMAALLIVVGGVEGYRYFGVWTNDPNTATAFAQDYVDVGQQLNALPAGTPRFVIVEANSDFVVHQNPDGARKPIPMPAQTVMFETIGHPPATYLLRQDVPSYSFPPDAVTLVIK
jgi:hypothetical protein